jgi:hypothetical protein
LYFALVQNLGGKKKKKKKEEEKTPILFFLALKPFKVSTSYPKTTNALYIIKILCHHVQKIPPPYLWLKYEEI